MTNKTPETNSTNDVITQLRDQIIESIYDRKGYAVTLLDLSEIEGAAASEFIICQGNSPTQVSAIADNIREELLEKLGRKPFNYDGYRNSEWIVIDYGDILVHVFRKDVREHYNLEDLWSDAVVTTLPDRD
ncbi:MAG: ribosome silencing factor [Bacteroides sp.]|nr:ribosome silencing factor [Bacteroides sp.]MDE5810097.1 ribosome silencing factor [Muribaculaceae bacterium]